jgi:hypothetical protein
MKFQIDRAQTLIIFETRTPVNFVHILMTAYGAMRLLPNYI